MEFSRWFSLKCHLKFAGSCNWVELKQFFLLFLSAGSIEYQLGGGENLVEEPMFSGSIDPHQAILNPQVTLLKYQSLYCSESVGIVVLND